MSWLDSPRGDNEQDQNPGPAGAPIATPGVSVAGQGGTVGGPVNSGSANTAGGGAAPGGAPAAPAAPGSAAPAAGGGNQHAPAFTNLVDWLNDQSAGEGARNAAHTTNALRQSTDQTNQATGTAQQNSAAAVNAGKNTGSVGVFHEALPTASRVPAMGKAATAGVQPPPTPSPAPPAAEKGRPPPSKTPYYAKTQVPNIFADAFRATQQQVQSHIPAAAAVPKPADVQNEGVVDTSNVNLKGYQGPDASQVASKFAAANAAGAQAHNQAAAAQTGHVAHSGNAFDNATATQTPAWQGVMQSVGAANQATQNAQSAQNAAGESAAQAQRAGQLNVQDQKGQLSDAAKKQGATAASNQALYKTASAALDSPTASGLDTILAQPALMKTLGIDPGQLKQLRTALASGSLTPAQVKTALAGYASAAKGATGYSTFGAQNQNTINGLLGNGAPQATATAAGDGSAVAPALAQQMAPAARADVQVAQSYYAHPTPAGAQQIKAAIDDLAKQGYTPDQIKQMIGQ